MQCRKDSDHAYHQRHLVNLRRDAARHSRRRGLLRVRHHPGGGLHRRADGEVPARRDARRAGQGRHARPDLRAHPLLRRVRARHGHPGRGARQLPGDPRTAVVEDRPRADPGGLPLQRAGLPGRRHPPRHHHLDRPPRQPQRHRRVAGRHRRGGEGRPACAPACATRSPIATATAGARVPASPRTRASSASCSDRPASPPGRLVRPARQPDRVRRHAGGAASPRRSAWASASTSTWPRTRPTRPTASRSTTCAWWSGWKNAACWGRRRSPPTASTSTPTRWTPCAPPARTSPTSRAAT